MPPTPNVSDLGDTHRTVWSGCKNNASVEDFIESTAAGTPGLEPVGCRLTREELSGKITQTVDDRTHVVILEQYSPEAELNADQDCVFAMACIAQTAAVVDVGIGSNRRTA